MFGLNKSSGNPFLEDTTTKKKRDLFTDFIQTVVLALAFSLILYLVFLVPSIVDGPSMEDSFYDKELLFANKVIQWAGNTSIGENYNYKRGDVVIFKLGDSNLIKRIIAGPGDMIRIEDNTVYVNGQALNEKYISQDTQTALPGSGRSFISDGETIRVPENQYFVMGDNREVSKDSRFDEVGFVEREQMRGKVFLRYWPIDRFGTIGTGEYE